jgi:hypothetical protein
MLQPMKLIIVRMMGGTGNQFFQYALVDYLINNNNKALLDTSHYSLNKTYYSEAISMLTANNKNIFVDLSTNIFYRTIFKSAIFKHLYNAISNKYYLERIPNLHLNLSQIHRAIKLKNSFLIEGYFQGFYTISDTLKNNLVVIGKSSLEDYENQHVLSKILIQSNSVSLHVRRGDYLEGDQLRVLGVEYYENAIERITESIGVVPHLYVFSDDIEWCKNAFDDKFSIHFVDINRGKNSYKDIFLMASCKHNIISASTFSWWAGYLNDNPSKIVIAPKFWYCSKFRYKENFDLRVSGWIYI